MSSENLNTNLVNTDEMSLKELFGKFKEWFRYLISKWMIIVALGLVGGVLGFLYAKSKKAIFIATTTFVLEEGGGGGMGQYAGIASMVGIDLGGGGTGLFQGDNILQLYKSRSMIKNALLSTFVIDGKKELLIDQYIKSGNFRKRWGGNPKLKDITFPQSGNFNRTQDSILNEFVREINNSVLNVSKPDKKLSIIKVTVKSIDENFAKSFNDQMVATVSQFYVDTKTKKSLENVSILQQKTDSVVAVMNGAISISANTIDATPNLNPTRQILRTPVQRSQFNAETNKELLKELMKNLELSKISLRKESPLIQVVDSPIFPLEIDKFGKSKGIILGGFWFGFLTVLFFLVKKVLRDILA
ncbi:hypothetical protein SAMN05421820_105153 [Pedobacter steynii]|uniref:Lipopolysaccharide biosynthesis protein n=1 Tax=Pedobacter steynii TaxID=430522 RepID=A0A1G9WEZ8_9SPHI|nr:lipopolysaccharide biosynthesis protein [Pedobacter steynii]NQX40277.1 lipopolysaccharide biosynthesis protein [Pedobacter steynii]SDM83060.1 hypothetical protein SAMN05421820_105153 [Pedobacter steynii]